MIRGLGFDNIYVLLAWLVDGGDMVFLTVFCVASALKVWLVMHMHTE